MDGFETLDDYLAKGFNVHAKCECGRIEILYPTWAVDMLAAKGHPPTIAALKAHFKCKRCGGRLVDVRRRRGW